MLTLKDNGERRIEVSKNGQVIGQIAPAADDPGYAAFKPVSQPLNLSADEFDQIASALQTLTTH